MSKTETALKLALKALEVATTPLAKDRQEVLRARAAIREALAQPEQEPVAWRREYEGDVSDLCQWLYADEYDPKDDSPNWQPLYTTPPQRKPLTDEEIILIVADCASSHQHTDIHFARAIEAAHGIKE